MLSESEAQFNEALKERGGLFNRSALKKETQSVFNRYQKRACDYIESCRNHESLIKEAPDIYFDYINNPGLGAAALRTKDGKYLIGINAGSIVIIYDLFFRMLSYRSLFKSIGNPDSEAQEAPSIRNYYTDASLLVSCGDLNYDKFRMSIPKDPIRKEYALHLADIAIDFLVAHELTHIINGHLGFLINCLGTNSYQEENATLKDESQILTIQTLEMDADCMAASKGLGNAVRRHLGKRDVSEGRKAFYNDFDRTMFDWAIATTTITRIMVESVRYKIGDSKPQTHPHPRVRQLRVHGIIFDYLNKYYPELLKRFTPECNRELVETLELAYTCITGNKADNEEYLKAVDQGKQELPKVLEHWKKIRPDLLKYSYVKLVQ